MNINNIDNEQRIIVEQDITKPCFVYAGPGSGKTHTLISRLMYIQKQHDEKKYDKLKPNILMLTFSKSAKTEMRERVENALKQNEYICNVKIFTFHSFALNLISKYYLLLGFTSFPKICSYIESLTILEEAIVELSSSNTSFNKLISFDNKEKKEKYKIKKQLIKIINDAKGCESKEKSKAYIIARMRGNFEYGDLFEKFQNLLLEKGLLQFSDMLIKAMELLSNNNDVAEEIRSFIDYILVDEFQDTNDLQLSLFQKLIVHGNITVVGDTDQLIYRFQGANDANLSKLEENFKSNNIMVNKVYLNNNYRSTPVVS
jgi:DNA helicase-2/ATP-dependent DNA helicase PcrA